MAISPNADNRIIKAGRTLEEVLRAVQDATAHNYRTYAPIHVFRQGERTMISAAIPVNVLINILISDPAERNKPAASALGATNRPFMKDHCDVIADYLKKALLRNQNYIIPPLALNVLDPSDTVRIYVPEGDSPSTSGYMILPNRASIHITDGQHRFRAIEQVAKDLGNTPEGSRFLDDSVLVMMTLSRTTLEVHQDFADAGRTKPLPPSLLAAYDTRQPANNVAMRLIESVPLFTGRINSTGNSVSQSSPCVFTGNQILQFVKHSLAGTTGVKEAQFTELAETSFVHDKSLERWSNSRVAFLNVMTEIISDWREIAGLSQPDGPDSADVVQKTKDVKQRQNVTMSGALLNALGLVSYQVLKGAASDENADKDETAWHEELKVKLEPFRSADWSRSGPLWKDNIVIGDKIRTQAPAVKGAADQMLELLEITDQSDSAQVA